VTALATITAPPPEPPVVRLDLRAAVARRFTPEELRAAAAWLAEHTDLPKPITARLSRELKRLKQPDRLSDDDYDALIDSAADGIDLSGEIKKQMEAAAIAGRNKPRYDRTSERFMSTLDEYVEPYLAVQRGMPVDEAAQRFEIADIHRHLADVDTWLSLCELLPRFDRATFLARLEDAVDRRRRDAGMGAALAAIEREAFTKPTEPESVEKRGAEWATIDNIEVPRKAKRLTLKKDRPWKGTPALPPTRTRLAVEEKRKTTTSSLGAQPVIDIPPPRMQVRKRELEQGLLVILDAACSLLAISACLWVSPSMDSN
jgi:hypothetical protein